jgi:alpha-galactosidase
MREIIWSEVPHLKKGGNAYHVVDIWSGRSLGCVAHGIKTVVGVHDTVGYVVGERCNPSWWA